MNKKVNDFMNNLFRKASGIAVTAPKVDEAHVDSVAKGGIGAEKTSIPLAIDDQAMNDFIRGKGKQK